MRIVGLHPLGQGVAAHFHVPHGEDPRMILWRQGWTVGHWLSASLIDGEVVVTAEVRPRMPGARPPKVRSRGLDPNVTVAPGEKPQMHQRIAAYAIVRSTLGVLGTTCSEQTAVPGMWQLPGGGLEPGESPAQGVRREVSEETAQSLQIDRLIDLQSDHWIGRAPNGQLEDFHALRIIYTATCDTPTRPIVLDVGGTTASSSWVPVRHWRTLAWTSGARSALDRHLSKIPVPPHRKFLDVQHAA